MATWIEILGYTSSGTVIGLLVKSIFDVLRAERAHTLELRRRFFDKKLELTIAGLSDAKRATSLLRSSSALLKRAIEKPGTLHPKVTVSILEGFREAAERLKQSDLSASASFGFLYGKLFFDSAKDTRDVVVRLTDLISQLYQQIETLPELLVLLTAGDKNTETLTAAAKEVAKMVLIINQLDSEAQNLDEKLDSFTDKVSRSFGRLRT